MAQWFQQNNHTSASCVRDVSSEIRVNPSPLPTAAASVPRVSDIEHLCAGKVALKTDGSAAPTTHPQLLTKPKEAGVVSLADLKVLSKALGVKGQEHDRRKGSTPPVTPTPQGRSSVLDNEKFGPGNRLYWEMKEGRVISRCSDLLRALSKEHGPNRRRHCLSLTGTR